MIAVAIIIAGVLISASLFVALGDITRTTTITQTVTKTLISTPTITESASGVCLREVPQESVFSSYSNSTSQGYTVTYLNGTEDYFPLNTCPVPVTHDNFVVDSTIEADPGFVAAENGYIYEATNACNCSWSANITNPSGQQWAVFNFVLYGDQQIYPCGTNSFWMFNRLGLISVTIPINSTGGLQFSNAEIGWEPGNNIVYCTTTQTA
jgi:hypothetical protein